MLRFCNFFDIMYKTEILSLFHGGKSRQKVKGSFYGPFALKLKENDINEMCGLNTAQELCPMSHRNCA